jgi:NAD-dependent deacetylase sirtuin 4
MRPDGDAQVKKETDYNHVHVPNCPHCKTGFLKPDVVFFGDTVPKHRVALCQEAVEMADGILVVGSSLAVHSAYRHIRAASAKGTPVAILNVGETRAEKEGLEHILKIEAPAGDTLELCLKQFAEDQPLSTAANM